MPSFSTEVNSSAGTEAATDRLKQFLEKVRERYKDQVASCLANGEGSILNFSLTTYGINVNGTVDR